MKGRALLLVVLMATAGCLGLGEEDAPEAEPGSQDLDPEDEDPTNETEEPTYVRTWTRETYEGWVTGTGAPFGLTIVPLSENNQMHFQAEEGVERLHLNLTVEDGELEMLVGGPDCEANSGCEDRVTTSDGEAAYTNETPEPGEWRIRLFPADPVALESAFELKVAQAILAPEDG